MKQFVDKLNRLEEIIASSLLIITSLIVFMQVILRYGFNFTLPWVEESARYMIVWFVFLGASIGVRENAHPSMDTLQQALPGFLKPIFRMIVVVICMIFCVIVIRSGMNVVISAYGMGSTSPALQMPLFIPYLAVPVGLTLMFIRYAVQLKDLIVGMFKNEAKGADAS
ncbi:MAG: TRAP transporter small permease [Defluviitaleaceae bacterium]|nr:TRAP transporter small permease [Defluviitaleaceae bacterium]